jgi:hypothetical protein
MLPRARLWLGLTLVLIAVATLAARLPSALSGLHATAARNATFDVQGRTLAVADSLSIDNGFVVAALADLPGNATFAIVPPAPAAAQHMSPVTINALDGYFQYLLLPRREVTADRAGYLLCYACDTGTLHGKVRWIYSAAGGLKIGTRAHT